MKGDLQIRAYRDFSRRIISVFAFSTNPDGEELYAETISLKQIEDMRKIAAKKIGVVL